MKYFRHKDFPHTHIFCVCGKKFRKNSKKKVRNMKGFKDYFTGSKNISSETNFFCKKFIKKSKYI